MPRYLSTLAGLLAVAFLIAAPVCFAVHQQNQMRNFRTVRDGVLYRSGQMSIEGLKRAVHDFGIKTVVSLRDSDRPTDQDEERYCKDEDIQFIRLPPREWWAPAGPAPADENVAQFRAIMADPTNYPVLVHCFAGVHRTGAYCAVYRMEQERWTNEAAIAEMRNVGYVNLDDEWDVLGYLEEYRATWKCDPPEKAPVTRKRPPIKPGKHAGKSVRKHGD
jgi:protein tyrosine/serine phosphatase